MRKLLDSYFNFINKCIPSKQEGNSVGIDLGAQTCKLVEIKRNEKSFELVSWAEQPLNEGVPKAITSIVSHCQTPPTSIYTSVFGKGTLIRYIPMPRMSLEDLRGAFSIEADKYFPFPQDQIYTDCYILDPQSKTKEMSVLAAAAKRELIDERIKMIKECGLEVNFIGINAIALANVVNVLGVEGVKQEDAIAILDMGDSVSNLSILKGSVPRFTRDIYLGGRDFTKRMMNMLGLEAAAAEELKRNPSEKKTELMNACESLLMNLVQELRLSFDYFSTEKNVAISKLFLVGGGSRFSDIDKFLQENLEIETHYWDPLSSLVISPDKKTEELKQKAHQLGVALGLSLYHYD